MFVTKIIIFSTIIGVTRGNCGIALHGVAEASFTFVEVQEDFPVGGLLASYPVYNTVLAMVLDPDEDEGSLVSILYNQSHQHLEFYLRNNLSDYRHKKWSPAVEIKYQLFCAFGIGKQQLQKIYSFLVIVQDCNLYAPLFGNDVYYYSVTFPWPWDLYPLNRKAIAVTDLDYNFDHAAVQFSCVGEECHHFSIEVELVGDTDHHGYSYRLNVNLLQNSSLNSPSGISVGTTVSIAIVAKDANFSSEALVNFTAANVRGAGPDHLAITIIVVGVLGVVGCFVHFGREKLLATYNDWKTKMRNILWIQTDEDIRDNGLVATAVAPRPHHSTITPVTSTVSTYDFGPTYSRNDIEAGLRVSAESSSLGDESMQVISRLQRTVHSVSLTSSRNLLSNGLEGRSEPCRPGQKEGGYNFTAKIEDVTNC